MFSKIYDILRVILGESKQGGYISGCSQYQWNCPSCAEEKGGVDYKYNLEISFTLGKFHCWACDTKGNISYLIKKYGNQSLLNDYNNEINNCLNKINKNSLIRIKYYDGDSYIESSGKIKKIDNYRKKIYFLNTIIDIDNIVDIEVIDNLRS